jgi:hypothetical protein
MKIKNYSVAVHMLHSRLQLVRGKLDADKSMLPSTVVTRNIKVFERAAESVQRHHELHCGRTEFYGAAELFLFSLDPEESNILNQPLWQRKQDQNDMEI